VRFLRIAANFLLVVMWVGCGNYYRPVAVPIIPTPPSPGFSYVAVVITGNGAGNPGAATTIDVSGDTAASTATVGLMPVAAVLAIDQTKVFVANSGDNTVSTFGTSTPSPVNTISLPPGSVPDFIASTETANIYVANGGNGTVSVIATSNNVVTTSVATGGTPIMLSEIPNGQKLYVLNGATSAGNGSVLSINTIDKTANLPVGTWISPVWAVSRNDSQRVYVLDKAAGSVTAIDTSFDTVVGATTAVGVGADYMVYDPTLSRLYVTNPVTNTLTILNASTDSLSLVGTPISIPGAVSVAALVDGSKVYVSGSVVTGQTVAATETVLNAATLGVIATIPLSSVPVASGCPAQTWSELSMAAAADSSRVYVGNCDAGNTAIIQTSNNTVVTTIAAPPGVLAGTTPTVQKPIFVLAGVL
jgi:YVTN family beta-propeller protein